jgi:hypothetical protein
MSSEQRMQLRGEPLPEDVVFSPMYLIDWAAAHLAPAVIVTIEAFANYHHYHGRSVWGVLCVTLYGVAQIVFHLAAYWSTGEFIYYFESNVPVYALVLISIAYVLGRSLLYVLVRVVLRRRWRAHIARGVFFLLLFIGFLVPRYIHSLCAALLFRFGI